jgi:hypothetical protein
MGEQLIVHFPASRAKPDVPRSVFLLRPAKIADIPPASVA